MTEFVILGLFIVLMLGKLWYDHRVSYEVISVERTIANKIFVRIKEKRFLLGIKYREMMAYSYGDANWSYFFTDTGEEIMNSPFRIKILNLILAYHAKEEEMKKLGVLSYK